MKLKKQKIKTTFFLVIGLFLLVSPGYSAIYHIDPGAKAGGNGSPSSPFNSWWSLPLNAMKTSDQVYFKCNTTYSPPKSLIITWEGNNRNPAVIGSYYIENNQVVYGVKGNRPIISGSNHTVPENSYYGSTDSWRGLIQVYSKNYVHIKDLHILNSGWQGIRLEGNLNSGTNSSHFLVKNIKDEGSWHSAIVVNTNSYNYGIIEDSEVVRACSHYPSDRKQWPVSLVVANSPYSYTTIRRNYVHETWGEGIGSIRAHTTEISLNSGHAIIEDNVIWNNRRASIYIDGTEGNTVRRNIILGAGANTVGTFASSSSVGGRVWNQLGIGLCEEKRTTHPYRVLPNNNLIYNNLISGHIFGLYFDSEFDHGSIDNVKFYNNTLIGNYRNINVGHRLEGHTLTKVEFKNNISYCPDDTICTDIHSDFYAYASSKIRFDFNAWTIKPKNYGGPNDKIVDNKWVKTQGWQKLTSIPNINDFAMTAGNSAIKSGTSVGETYKKAIKLIKTSIDPYSPSGISIATIDQVGNNWDMGAILYESIDISTNPVVPLAVPAIKKIETVN
jgi:parallel beta-helix repeat protein